MSTPHEETPLNPSVWSDRTVLLQGVAIGAVYGVIFRGLVGLPHLFDWLSAHVPTGAGGVMTFSFLVLGPLAVGFLCIARAEARDRTTLLERIFAPWGAVLLMMATVALIGWEGSICIVMAMPIGLILASIGGLIAPIFRRKGRVSNTTMSCVALLPLLLFVVEARVTAPTQVRTVSSEIRIHASKETVWRNIERVPAIAPTELRPTWAHRIGFPRPVEATLSYEGVGGVRHASFERGVMFIETITAWEPNQRLAFTIKADTVSIPPTTFDEHVTIGGPYFDVLTGEYRIEQLPGGDVLLHLSSHERLSTDINGYAGLWTDAVMQDLQTSILQVIQHRCEHA